MRSRRAVASGASAVAPTDVDGSRFAALAPTIGDECGKVGGRRRFGGGSGVTIGGAGVGGCSTGGAIVTGDDGDVSGGASKRALHTGGLRTAARAAAAGDLAASAPQRGGSCDSGTSVGGPCGCAVSGAEASSPGGSRRSPATNSARVPQRGDMHQRQHERQAEDRYRDDVVS
jgi:hypothetical protein